jgi:hypothetical protein
LLEAAETFVGQEDMFCSQFVTTVVQLFRPEAVEDAIKVPCQDPKFLPYISVAGFIGLFASKPMGWNSLPSIAYALKPSVIVCYYPESYTIPPDPNTVARADRHISIVRKVIRSERISEDFYGHFVEVIDSTSRTYDGRKLDKYRVSVNHIRVYISDAKGNLLGFQWAGGFDVAEIKNGNFNRKHFVLAELKNNQDGDNSSIICKN